MFKVSVISEVILRTDIQEEYYNDLVLIYDLCLFYVSSGKHMDDFEWWIWMDLIGACNGIIEDNLLENLRKTMKSMSGQLIHAKSSFSSPHPPFCGVCTGFILFHSLFHLIKWCDSCIL